MRDKQLAAEAQRGSLVAFEQIETNYRPQLYRTILAITRNHEDAEDALQDTFLRAYVGLRYFEGRSSVYSWLTRIAINSSLMLLRKRRARAEVFFSSFFEEGGGGAPALEFRDMAPNPEQLFDQRQLSIGLRCAIERLDPKLRGPILMHLVTEGSMKEIAEGLNISIAAVKARLHRARTRLKATTILRSSRTKQILRAS
jgi:RNA polymerase sigma-70 factor (ECF subfamily)